MFKKRKKKGMFGNPIDRVGTASLLRLTLKHTNFYTKHTFVFLTRLKTKEKNTLVSFHHKHMCGQTTRLCERKIRFRTSLN